MTQLLHLPSAEIFKKGAILAAYFGSITFFLYAAYTALMVCRF